MKTTPLLGLIAGLLLAGVSATASAGYSWDFSKSACSGLKAGTTEAFTTCASTGTPSAAPDATVRAYSNTGTGSTLEQGYVGAYSSDPANLGVVNKFEDPNAVPNHSMDNEGNYDSLFLSFASAVKLTSLSLGWSQTDSDITVMAYTGNGAPTLAGSTYSNLASSGWTLVGHYADLVTGANTAINAGNYASSYWLIGAYNPLVGNSQGWSTGNDYVKLKTLAGDSVGRVSEPASLALAGFALIGVLGLRRRSASR